MYRRLGWEIERVILVFIIGLTILNFFNLLSPFWEYVQNIIGWISIAYLLYALSPTQVFFGERHSGPDFLIVLSYVLLSAKTFVSNAIAGIPQLITAAPSYIRLSHTTLPPDVLFPVSTAEFNSITIANVVPQAAKLATYAASNITMANQHMVFNITNGVDHLLLLATPTTLDGTMLMFYNSIRDNAATIQAVSLVAGMLLLLFVSIYAAYRIPVKKPSILAAVKEEGGPTALRAFWVFLLLAGFFVMVFNLLFEWMSVTDDTVLLMICLIVIFFLYLLKRDFRTENLLEELGEIGEDFYVRVIKLFTVSETLLLGITGFLVLHLLTDIGNFLAPAIAGYQTMYSELISGSHASIYSMIAQGLGNGIIPDALLVIAYVLSAAGILLLLSMPAVIWYTLFKLRTTGSREHIPDWKPWHVGLVLACVTIYFFLPVFSISSVNDGTFVGVNLISTPITAPVTTALEVALGVFILCVIIGSLHDYARRILMIGPFGIAVAFFGIYVYNYFTSSFVYYAQSLVLLAKAGEYVLVPIVFIFFAFTIVFYITGFFSFLYEIWRD